MLDMLYFGWKLLRERQMETAVQNEIRRDQMALSKLDTWAGIEMQVRQRQSFYNHSQPWWECGVYWNGDTRKFLQLCMGTVQINQAYQKSGLSAENFCRKYYAELFRKYPAEHPFWTSDFTKWERDITLYDDYDHIVHAFRGASSTAFVTYNGETVQLKLEEKMD